MGGDGAVGISGNADTEEVEAHEDTREPLARKADQAHRDLRVLRVVAERVELREEEERMECLRSVDLMVNLENKEKWELSDQLE